MNTRSFLLCATAFWLRGHADVSMHWDSLPCCIGDIGVGPSGAVWVIGKSSPGLNADVYQWNGTTWVQEPGLHGTAIAVDPSGRPWIVNAHGDIFRPSDDTWERVLVGRANDIGIGADGSVWITGYEHHADVVQDADVFRWDGTTWVKEPGAKGVRIGVAPTGAPMVVDTSGTIFQLTLTNSTWVQITGQAADVGFGADGSAWITGGPPDGTDHDVSRRSGTGWETASGAQGTRISVASNGEPWVVSSTGEVFVGHLGALPPPTLVIDPSQVVVAPGGVTVTINTVTNTTYNLEARNTINAPLWRAADSKPGTGQPVSLHDDQNPGAAGFFRVRAVQP